MVTGITTDAGGAAGTDDADAAPGGATAGDGTSKCREHAADHTATNAAMTTVPRRRCMWVLERLPGVRDEMLTLMTPHASSLTLELWAGYRLQRRGPAGEVSPLCISGAAHSGRSDGDHPTPCQTKCPIPIGSQDSLVNEVATPRGSCTIVSDAHASSRTWQRSACDRVLICSLGWVEPHCSGLRVTTENQPCSRIETKRARIETTGATVARA